MTSVANRILLTGPPGCGKTTVVKRVLDLIPDRKVCGFFTEELRVAGRRVGFDMIGLNAGRYRLSHVESESVLRVSRFGVELDGLERLVESELTIHVADADLIVIDEIAKAECFSDLFVQRVRELFDFAQPILATVAISGLGLINDVKERHDIELIHVTNDNRDELPQAIAYKLS